MVHQPIGEQNVNRRDVHRAGDTLGLRARIHEHGLHAVVHRFGMGEEHTAGIGGR